MAVGSAEIVTLLFRCLAITLIESSRERQQQLRAVTVPSAAVHAGENSRFEGGEPCQNRSRLVSVSVEIQLPAKGIARPENVALENWGMVSAAIGAKVAAQQRPGRMLHD